MSINTSGSGFVDGLQISTYNKLVNMVDAGSIYFISRT
jgi:hypothetical protein